MNNLFKDVGSLSDEGNKLVETFRKSLTNLLEDKNVLKMSSVDKLVLQSNLAKILGDAMFEFRMKKE